MRFITVNAGGRFKPRDDAVEATHDQTQNVVELIQCAAKASAEVRDALFIEVPWFNWRPVERATHEASTPALQ